MNVMPNEIKKGRKFEQVLEGARKVFMADGFEGASVDNIAKAAGVSKATLYSYFSDKKSLFSEVARAECCRQSDRATSEVDFNAPAPVVLREAAAHLLEFFTSEFGQQTFRICIAESDRFPELGPEFYESGPKLVQDTLIQYFELAIENGDLVIDDLHLAANQFIELCKAVIFPRLMFGVQTEFTQEELDRTINGAVDMFIARYGAKS